MSMCSTARMASRFSVIDTGSPAARSSCTNPWRTSSIDPSGWIGAGAPPAIAIAGAMRSRPLMLSGPRRLGDELLARLHEVGLGREEDDRSLGADDGAELGDRDLEVGEHLEQERFGLDLDPVDLVDEQHDGL